MNAHFHGADAATFALHDAQLVLARAYGFDSWPKLKAYVDGVTVRCLVGAVRAGDLVEVRAMLKVRPELARMSTNNLQVLHYAVLDRVPEIVRVLMEHGANAREGVYPHRDATSALAIAAQRGYDDIVVIIKNEEERRRSAKSATGVAPEPDDLFQAIASGEVERAIAMMVASPALIHIRHDLTGSTPLHVAAESLNAHIVAWLLDHGANVMARGRHDQTPLDLAAYSSNDKSLEHFTAVDRLLRGRGAALTARAAVAIGETDWLRARYSEGLLTNLIENGGGLLRIAASHNRPGILALLLDFGFDPDERTRIGDGDDIVFTWGMPLYHCAGSGKYEMAEMLLQRGADPNAKVFASGDPVFQAYSQSDWKMVKLLERYGGVPARDDGGALPPDGARAEDASG